MAALQPHGNSSQTPVIRVLSLDIPWGGKSFVGAAFAELRDGLFTESPAADLDDLGTCINAPGHRDLPRNRGPVVTSIRTASVGEAGLPNFPIAHPEVEGFIANGAGPGRNRPADLLGPFNAFPNTRSTREAYLRQLWGAFHSIRCMLSLPSGGVNLLLVDMPTIPAALAVTPLLPGLAAQYRPVETAFGNKVWIPGASIARADGRIQFPRFQPGNINGCRPAYAVFELARQVFGGASVVESFPQLTLGPLAEFAQAFAVPMIAQLAGHKTGNAARMLVGQQHLDAQLVAFLGGVALRWAPSMVGLTTRARADGYDAVLGLLPGLVWAGYVPPATTPSPWQRAVVLRNQSVSVDVFPITTGVGLPTTGARTWIRSLPTFGDGVDDSGILSLDMSLWG